MTQYGFYFDSTRCTGCHTCEIACKDYHDLTQAETFRRVYDCEYGATDDMGDGTVTSTALAYHVSAACNHCANPGCMAAAAASGAPDAIEKDADTGIVLIVDAASITDPDAVAAGCPYGVPVTDSHSGLLVKCDACHDRVAAGLRPVCVEACPLRALDFGDMDELAAAHPDATDRIAPLPDPSLTGPSLLVDACPASVELGEEDPTITNTKTLAGVAAGA